jgi:hypothetical protein
MLSMRDKYFLHVINHEKHDLHFINIDGNIVNFYKILYI